MICLWLSKSLVNLLLVHRNLLNFSGPVLEEKDVEKAGSQKVFWGELKEWSQTNLDPEPQELEPGPTGNQGPRNHRMTCHSGDLRKRPICITDLTVVMHSVPEDQEWNSSLNP
ncbi:unnamed protein product [Natator depressus]